MIQNQATYDKLYDAAETIYKHLVKDHGFFSGYTKNEFGRSVPAYNSFTGAKKELEKKLNRELTVHEITMLSLAIGFGPTPALSKTERDQAFLDLWEGKPNHKRDCLTFDRLVTCI